MNILLGDDLLRCAARQMAGALALSLPETGEQPSAAFEERMAPLLARMRRRRVSRRAWQRAAAAAVTVVLALGIVLAVSPAARAAVSRWFLRMTELAAVYRIDPAAQETAPEDYTPTAPPDYTLTGDYTGAYNGEAGSGIRVMRWTSGHGDLLFQSLPLTGDVPISVELRGSDTGGLYCTETGQRPLGGPGTPEGYETESVTVHGMSAQMYHIAPAEEADRNTPHGFGLWFYRGEEPVHFHHLSVPEGGTVLLWVDERANSLFLLTGGASQEELLSTAESMYQSERS